ncbi:hypothetical protein B0H14DRAFT_2657978 [Mycena olivaceomarginata]|nr:hypothetical protein B0H14DRAFT_2657978 [Mycena olivaceomarginata]
MPEWWCVGRRIFLGQPLLPLVALNALIQPGCKYDYTNVLAAAVARIAHMNPQRSTRTTTPAAHQWGIAPHRGLSSDLVVLAREHGIAAALPAMYYHTLVVGNNNSLLLDGLACQDGTCSASLPPLGLHRCLIGREHLLAKPFSQGPGYTLGWPRAWPQNPMRRCRTLRKSVFCRFMDDGVVAGLHKFRQGKAYRMLCGACVKGRGRRLGWAPENVGRAPGFLTCHLG